jgi:hypothetical protein
MAEIRQLPRRDAVWAQKEVRRIVALGASHVIFTDHAIERMDERGFYRHDVMNALRLGTVDCAPRQDKGGMSCKVTRRMSSGRDCGVVNVIKAIGDKLIIVTVEWEDVP